MQELSRLTTALILLPISYNPDEAGKREPIEDEKFWITAEEVSRELRVEGGTIHLYRDGNVRGIWWDRSIVDRDTHAVIEIDMEDTTHSRRNLIDYVREVLLNRFRQKAIYIKFIVPVDRLVVTEEKVTP
jgi:hypothetical protein